jgi:NADH-quinone oxidoreductase subunit F
MTAGTGTSAGARETPIVTRLLRDRPDDSFTIEAALQAGAYSRLDRLFAMAPEAVIEEVTRSGMRGKGGAGFGTGQKWSFLPKDVYPRYVCINADEGEPATFKDRMLIERDPHQLIEGTIITAYAVRAGLALVYVRGEFALGAERLEQAITEAYARGFLGHDISGSGFDLDIVVHRGAGCYIAGDETALLTSLEGERAMPRIKPPFPAGQGLYAAPTVVNNVETVSTLPHIIEQGAGWYAAMGVGRSRGTRIFSVSGHVARPGNYEIELGMSFRDLIEGLAGGMPGGRPMKFFIPGGASSPWLLPEHLDTPIDIDLVQSELGDATTMLGSGAITVFDDSTDPLAVAWRIAKFFAHESCGKCTPCREGTGWIERILYRMLTGYGRPEDLDLLVSVGSSLAPGMTWPPGQTTICPLGPSAASPLLSLHRYFREEVTARLARDAKARRRIPVTAGVTA